MFYQPSVIDNLLKCYYCIQTYSAHDQPRILPCCGKTFCSKCILLIEKGIKYNKLNKFKCMLCHKKIIVPVNEFMVNELAIKVNIVNELAIISEHPVEVNRGIETEKLKKNMTNLDHLAKKLLFEINNADYSIDEHFKEQERLVQLTTEEMVLEIFKRRDVLLQQLSDRRKVCLENSAKIEKFKKKANGIANQVSNQLEKDRAYLNQKHLDDNLTAASNDKLALLESQVEKQRREIKKKVFNEYLIQFKPLKQEADYELLGNFDLEQIDPKKSVS